MPVTMLEFRKLQLGDVNNVKKFFPFSLNRICDNTVGGAFMWRDYFSVEYAEFNETIIFKARVKYHNNITAFSVPLGKDVRGGVDMVVDFCRLNDLPVAFCTATNEDIKMLQTVFGEYRLFKETDWSDYIYKAADLSSLSGRRYNGQRNHINYFKGIYPDYSFNKITNDNIKDLIEFYKKVNLSNHKDNDVFIAEQDKVFEVLENYGTYGLIGGFLSVNDTIIAFSIGEVSNDTLYVHIEKADTNYRGAYQMIVNEFVKCFAGDGVMYVNREEDTGDDGLRKSKMSYRPCEIIDKYTVTVKSIISY